MKMAQAVSIRWLLRSRVLIFIAIANLVACETKPPSLESQAPQVLQQWLDAFNSGNPNQMAGFWRSYHETDALVRMEDDLDLRNVTGTMKVVKVTENTGTHLVALMKEQNGDYSESSVELASSNPLILERIGNYPIPKISRSELAAASDEDLATRIQNRIATQFPPENAFSGAILVAHQGRIILDRAWGMANSAKHIRNTIDTQFNIASMWQNVYSYRSTSARGAG